VTGTSGCSLVRGRSQHATRALGGKTGESDRKDFATLNTPHTEGEICSRGLGSL